MTTPNTDPIINDFAPGALETEIPEVLAEDTIIDEYGTIIYEAGDPIIEGETIDATADTVEAYARMFRFQTVPVLQINVNTTLEVENVVVLASSGAQVTLPTPTEGISITIKNIDTTILII